MSSDTSLNDLLIQIADCVCIKSPKFERNNSDNHGYIANVSKVAITDEQSNKECYLFVKQMPEATKHLADVYANEANFYLKTWNAFEELGNKLQTEMPIIPKCYHASSKMIIMEDLTKIGFKIWTPLTEPLDHKHIEATLKAYAKFHAYSFALKYHQPDKFATLGNKHEYFYIAYNELKNSGYFKSLTDKVVNAFDSESTYYKGFSDFMNTGLLKYLEELIKPYANDVIAHGDSWTHNFMYKYDESGDQIKVSLIDFQLTRLTALIRDLSYFFTTSACSQQVFERLDEYLKFYHARLLENLNELLCANNIYTWTTFKQDWEKYSAMGLLLGVIVNKMFVATPQELEERKAMMVLQQFNFISVNEHMYHERVRIIVKYFCDANILSQWC